jgi:hypothetical protein
LSTNYNIKSDTILYGEINIEHNNGFFNRILKLTNLEYMFITHKISIGFYSYGETITYENVKLFENIEFVECIQSNKIPVVITKKFTDQEVNYYKYLHSDDILEKMFNGTFIQRIKKSEYNCLFLSNSTFSPSSSHCVFGMGCLNETNEKARYVFAFNPYFLTWEEVGFIICKIFSEAE